MSLKFSYRKTRNSSIIVGLLTAALIVMTNAASAETPCEKALNSPPLSKIRYYVENQDSEYNGTSFGILFDRELADKYCTFDQMKEYIQIYFNYENKNIWPEETNYFYKYREKDVFRYIFTWFLREMGVVFVFDDNGNFLRSNWSY